MILWDAYEENPDKEQAVNYGLFGTRYSVEHINTLSHLMMKARRKGG